MWMPMFFSSTSGTGSAGADAAALADALLVSTAESEDAVAGALTAAVAVEATEPTDVADG
jgi:hypothetical protein